MRSHIWQPGQVFVFGSNLFGVHGAGAAKFARDHCGAVMRRGVGHFGESYALPTCSMPGVPLSLVEVEAHVRDLLQYVESRVDLIFFITRVGCGIAGFTDAQIEPLFRTRLPNCVYPPEWS